MSYVSIFDHAMLPLYIPRYALERSHASVQHAQVLFKSLSRLGRRY